ncbi:MAG: F0F1 ATP synthase subunit delta [Actinomycetia bacterium]|nr:F0F1 ATP synthase subunit delta [Actinomycetes bacterium]
MLGSSRDALALCSGVLDQLPAAVDRGQLGTELFAIAALLDSEKVLRLALADSGQGIEVRQNLATQVFGPRVGPNASDLLVTVVSQRWSEDMDLVLSLEELAAQAVLAVAQVDNTLDSTEEEIFLFGRAVDQSAELQMALTNPAAAGSTKAAIVEDLLHSTATTATRQLLEYSVSHLHGRRLDAVITRLGDLAAAQRQRMVAQVRVARPLSDSQSQRLIAALTALKGRSVRLNVEVDPAVLGGVYVVIGDEVIDGTISSRLEAAHRAILG